MADAITDKNLEEFVKELGDEEVYNQVLFLVDFVTQSNSVGEADRVLVKLEPVVNRAGLSKDIKAKYDALILRLKFVSLPLLALSQIEELFKSNLLYAFKNGVDLQDRVRRFFHAQRSGAEAASKNTTLQAIDANEEKIGNASIAEWLKQYKSTLKQTIPGTLEVVKFITDNKSSSQLDPASKELLKDLLMFYNWIRFKSSDSKPEIITKTPRFSKPSFEPPKKVFENPSPPPQPSKTDFEKRLAAAQAATKSAPKSQIPSPKELDREIHAKELPGKVEPKLPPRPISTFNNPAPKPLTVTEMMAQAKQQPAPAPKPQSSSNSKFNSNKPSTPFDAKVASLGKPINEINSLQELRNLSVQHLRQGPLASQLEIIKSKIYTLAKQKKVMPYYAVAQFEQSPLFRSYLSSGTALVSGSKGELTQQEFEALADLKRQIEQM